MDTYMVIGHGYDSDTLLQIPKGSVYVTFAECGDITNSYVSIIKAFEDNLELLKDPVTNASILKTIFGNSIHIHWAESPIPFLRTYYDSEYMFPLGWKELRRLCKSGVYKLGNPVEYAIGDTTPIVSPSPGMLFGRYTIYINPDDISLKDIQTVFNGSEQLDTMVDIYTTLKTENGIVTYDMIASKYSIKQSQLFETNPGIYYNFLCRITKSYPITNIKHTLRRVSSTIANKMMFEPYYATTKTRRSKNSRLARKRR